MNQQPSCSFTNHEEIEELQSIGVNVWGQEQTVLEQQALDEFTTFNKNWKLDREETDPTNSVSTKIKEEQETPSNSTSLDVTLYIRRQEELKKRQDYKRSLELSDKSKLIADQINNKQIKLHKQAHKCTEKGRRYNCSFMHKQSASDANLKTSRDIKEDNKPMGSEMGSKICKEEDEAWNDKSGSEYAPSEEDSDYDPREKKQNKKYAPKRVKLSHQQNDITKYEKVIDDGNIKCYNERMNLYYQQLENLNKQAIENGTELPETEILLLNNAKCSSTIWNSLYAYQREGVEWLWGIHQRGAGGLLGDEMGLGKTVQIIAFLYSLNYTRGISSYGGFNGLGPTLIVCPSTVVHQWVKHFHDWAPEFRVSILHQSGSYAGNKQNLIRENIRAKGILITTYQSMLKYQCVLTAQCWHYIILDEGHKIRNPGAKISEAVKLFKTPHKLLLTGSPMQNNLQELWSLFDFVKPGMLGTLQVFMEHFAMPIMQGGYSNATPMQEALALSIATALKEIISPHLLRRNKADVKEDIHLPGKSEQVLFCSITEEQRDLYKGYLLSDHIRNILGKSSKNWYAESYSRGNVLMSITTLRKICNHPDIYLSEVDDSDEEAKCDVKYGDYKRSGKMIVVAALLKMWKKQSHRVLLFTQSRSMLSIFQMFLSSSDYKFLKMDGSTSVVSRQPLIDKFNNDKSYDVFLLTTRVGGLGVNLTGANRVIIYDPDWNPATDTQARERAWRIGQDKEVTIYRLIAAGTIEEKMYQRQIWKQLLSNKILLDPKTQKFFKSSDLHDLFSLQEHVDATTETTNIFQNSRISLENKLKEKKLKMVKKFCRSDVDNSNVQFTDDKIGKMRQMAAQIAKNISKKATTNKNDAQIDLMQKDLLEERQAKLAQRAQLKKLTPTELLQYNRGKLLPGEEALNQLDDCDTDINFTKALVISEKAAGLYKTAKEHSLNTKCIDQVTEEYKTLTQAFSKPKKKSKHDKYTHKMSEDFSGLVEGEHIEGLVKRQRGRRKNIGQHKKTSSSEPQEQQNKQDNYILSKLFSKKGVQSALQHDSIIKCAPSEATSLKVHSETQLRTDLALQALRKSRISKWQC